jgi:hypothetical protein
MNKRTKGTHKTLGRGARVVEVTIKSKPVTKAQAAKLRSEMRKSR